MNSSIVFRTVHDYSMDRPIGERVLIPTFLPVSPLQIDLNGFRSFLKNRKPVRCYVLSANKSTLLTDPEHACSLIHRQLVDMCQRHAANIHVLPKVLHSRRRPIGQGKYKLNDMISTAASVSPANKTTHNDTNGLRKTNDFKCEHQFLS